MTEVAFSVHQPAEIVPPLGPETVVETPPARPDAAPVADPNETPDGWTAREKPIDTFIDTANTGPHSVYQMA